MSDRENAVDLTILVTAHNETTVCGPTMRSADLAIAAAEARGFTVERVIVLDTPTDDCRTYFTQPAFDHWQHWESSERDLGRTRNWAVPQCAGRFIAFLDSDDLFSENWLAEGVALLKEAEALGDRIIVHPELNWLFDGASSVFAKPDQDDPIFTPYHFYFSNYYDSLCLSPKAAHLAVPYVHRDIPNGLSFQDWQYSIETMAAGWRHVTARDTIIFKRRRDSSLVTESTGRQAIVRELEAMAIDRVMDLGKPRAGEEK